MRDQDDGDLVCQILQGDRNAFGTLFERHVDLVYGTVFRIIRNTADAEDVTQITFRKAFMRLKTWKNESSFSTWIVQIAINSSIDNLNKMRRRQRNERNETDLRIRLK